MIKSPERKLMDEAEMRDFYESLGISKATTERAIRVRRNMPVEQDKKKSPAIKGKNRKVVA